MRRLVLAALLGCAHAPPPAPPGFGLSKERAIEVCLPPGERAYLGGLRCGGGEKPHSRRNGSVGNRTRPVDENDPRLLVQMNPAHPLEPGEPDLHIVDSFEVRCPAATYTLFIDMYHCPAADQPAPRDFTLEK